ncbi:hypothetical protein HYC85_029575 [Camellia sinensis]|uniref:No apical meristem-associated C-terminal domain-containing protein n=1 Tax=Camellia sinensis TaxID=4442 RepID=A0A7J7G2A4_CAMSI|nr:hypothetical protein HYC85_029575 [Camellia sinensis]
MLQLQINDNIEGIVAFMFWFLKQTVVAHSTVEAEYRAMGHATAEIHLQSGSISLPFVSSTLQLADFFTKTHTTARLRDQPKWREEYSTKKQKPKKVATPGVCSPSAPDSINLEDNDVSHNDNVDLERPPGRKAEKERLNKRKNKDRGNEGGSPILILLEDLKEDRKKMNDKKIEMYERSYLQEQEKIDNVKKRTQTEQEKVDNEKEQIRMEQLKEEERIMSIDTSGLPSLQAEYLHRRQMEILQKKI